MSINGTSFADLVSGDDVKSCCASVYENQTVQFLLDGQLHPGGQKLTRHLAVQAGIVEGEMVLDVACGAGDTARLLAGEFGCEVVGVDYSQALIEQAEEAANGAGLAASTSYRRADAHQLPFTAAEFDVVVSECSLCTFEDKSSAVNEMKRVLCEGGRIAISDVTADVEELPELLRGVASQVMCVADALTVEGYKELFLKTGLELVFIEQHNDQLLEMVDRVEARLRVARMLKAEELEPFRNDIDLGIEMAGTVRESIDVGRLGYASFVLQT